MKGLLTDGGLLVLVLVWFTRSSSRTAAFAPSRSFTRGGVPITQHVPKPLLDSGSTVEDTSVTQQRQQQQNEDAATMFFASPQAADETKEEEEDTTTMSTTIPSTSSTASPSTKEEETTTTSSMTSTSRHHQTQQYRTLGSQELLMLPRQYKPGNAVFPSMNHVSVALLSATPSDNVLKQALQYVMQCHPLLHACVQGDGEPTKRIDLFQMVRKGEPSPLTFVADNPNRFDVDELLQIVTVADQDALETSWKSVFQRDLDNGMSWQVGKEKAGGPLWKVELHRTTTSADNQDNNNAPCALILTFNHAISDQSSANRLTDQILQKMAAVEQANEQDVSPTSTTPCKTHKMPVTLEDSVLGLNQRWSDLQHQGISANTIRYVAGKAAEGLKNPVILPDNVIDDSSTGSRSSRNPLGALSVMSGRAAGGQDNTQERRSTLQFRTLSRDATNALLTRCRQEGVTMSNALTAAVTLTATDFVGKGKSRNYKVLQSLDMGRFGARLDRGETVACMAGSHDLMHGPLPDQSGAVLRSDPQANKNIFWDLARDGKRQTEEFISSNGPQEAVRVFDFAMTISDLNNLVYQTAQSKDTKGRAYSAGVVNVGVYERQMAFRDAEEAEASTSSERDTLKIQHGRYQVNDIFFATPHTQSGCLYPVSCLTVDGVLKFTFNPVVPIVDEDTSVRFADALIDLLEVMAGFKEPSGEDVEGVPSVATPSILQDNVLTLVAAMGGLVAVMSHAGDYAGFFSSVAEMKANVEDPADFWAALNFWIFFAVGHPILQPILTISDVLHGSPGPMVGGLVPASFLLGNLVAIYAFVTSAQVRNAVNIVVVSAFFTYVGAGLAGTAGLGDYNLALDDGYKGQVVKGCPAYEEVRQPSMDNFDINKYQGLWYEHKFHDWTQFKEVYDTTLDIRLTEGGKGWIDDFAVKGPSPDAAPLSWDKSPVANGAHYFLFGRVDPSDPPGILREKGFGVEFPNYIVDVKKDANGEYKEAIQFQCLERGGVRVFEGINFMSRNEVMTEQELQDMHARAEKAGMYPYGASPEQMHTVAQRPNDAPPIDNNWQAMWRAIGFDRLLELLTESIEDGGR